MSRQSKPKEAVTLLLDVGQSVCQQDSDGQSFLQKSKQCASRIIQRKIFSDSVDEFSLILIGSEKTDNDLGFSNISVQYKWLTMPNWTMLNDVENLSATSVDNADWLDGIIVALNFLKNESEGKKFTKRKIVMMSNFSTQSKSVEQVDDVIESMKTLGIDLVVIGPHIDDGDEDDIENVQMKSKVQRKAEVIVSRIVEETGGVICTFNEAMSQLDHFQKFTGRAQSWNCDLRIGNDIFIPISGFKKFAPKPLLKWKKKSVEESSVTQELVHFHGDDQVEKADVINSYLFGQSVVPISGDDKTSMALTTEKSFLVVGFTKKQNVPRHMFLGDSVHYILPRDNERGAKIALTSLVKGLLELDMVGIVQKVYCKNATPRLGALIPTCEEGSYFFHFVALPFAEDERVLLLPSLKKVQPTQAQYDAVDQLIDSMDLSQIDEDDDPFSKLVDPSVEHTNSLIVFKALNPHASIPEGTTENIKNLTQAKLEMFENASEALNNINMVFKLEELEQKTYRRGAADVFDRTSNGDPLMDEDIKPQNLADSMAGFVQSTVTEVGTIDPEGNFLKLLEQGESFTKLCEQMGIALKKLLFTSSSTIGVKKPLSALTLLRKHCVIQNPLLYNQFISSLKDELMERENNEFWNLIAEDKLGLISAKESTKSSLSEEEVDIFYQTKKCESQKELDLEMEAEDVLDMIE